MPSSHSQDSTLSGHTDDSELNHEAPLISFSLGHDAIFLLGGPTREEEPMALRVRRSVLLEVFFQLDLIVT